MAVDNAKMTLDEKFRLIERDEERTFKAAEGLAEGSDLPEVSRIEAFDNSNIQGTNPVSAMVVSRMASRIGRNTANIRSRRSKGPMIMKRCEKLSGAAMSGY